MIKINGVEIKNTRFPNGEIKIESNEIIEREIDFNNNLFVDFYWHDNSDLIELYFIINYLKEIKKENMYIYLSFKYMPYSRMDRKENSSAFTLKYLTDWINTWNLDGVDIYEPHSDVCLALLDANVHYPTIDILAYVVYEIKFNNNDRIFYPDAGAQKRYHNLKYPNIVGFKNRDWETGKIKSLEICGDIPEEPFNVIIIDDLCSYGGTFLLSAKKLKEVGANDIYLIVGHCENSILDGEMINSDLIKRIYTTNSIFTGQHEKIEVCEVY
jgi:ribose-phosphate pyrophosphokinase